MMINDKINSPRPGQAPPPDPARHSRKCEVCRHPQREAIEEEFLHWHHPENIVDEYELNSRSSLYRHALAFGLYNQRRRNLRDSLELVVQEAERTTPTADAVIRAVRACSCITDEGRWIEPVKRVIVSRREIPAAETASIPEMVLDHYPETAQGRRALEQSDEFTDAVILQDDDPKGAKRRRIKLETQESAEPAEHPEFIPQFVRPPWRSNRNGKLLETPASD
jgi:hypothetical protein